MVTEYKTKDIKRRIHTEVHIKGEKQNKTTLPIVLQKCEKAGEKDTLIDRWKMSHETIGIKEIRKRVC